MVTGRQMQYGASYKGEETVVTCLHGLKIGSPRTEDRGKGNKKQRKTMS